MSRPSDLHLPICRLRGGVRTPHYHRNSLPPYFVRAGWSFAFFLSLLAAIFLNSCGGLVVSSTPPPPVIITVSPSSAQPFAGFTVAFTANVQNAGNSAISWQVNSIPGGNSTVGTISDSGLFTAPAVAPNPPTVTVTAVLQSDPTKSGSSSVTIQSQSSIQGPLTLTPALSSLTTSQSLQLQVTTPGVNNTQVTWAAVGGTITPTGLFPPSSAGSYLIMATLKANVNAIGLAQVKVTDSPGNLTWRNDNLRTGQNTKELVLAPSTVNPATFGKLFSCPVDGYVYAQPLYVPNLNVSGQGVHNVVIVATAQDTVYAFDADANSNPCVSLWQATLVPAGEEAVPVSSPPIANSDIPTDDIAPFIGITGTPVIDASAGTLYVVAETQTSSFPTVYTHRLYALDLGTGQRKTTGMQISTNPSTSPVFDSLLGNQRAALLLDNNSIYIAFGSHQGQIGYHGWLFSYDASNLTRNSVFVVTPGLFPRGGIWQSGGGPSADSNHNVYVSTGSGPFDANGGGSDYSDSFLHLINTAGALSVADYFTPCDQQTLSTTSQDIGSSAPVLLPDSAGSPSQPHLIVGGAKNGFLYVLNRDSLGGYIPTCPDSPARVQVVPVGSASKPILSTPLFWNNVIYVAAGNDTLKAFPMAGGVLATQPLSQSPEILGPQGATPVLSSNGANNAIIWLIDSSGAHATPNTPAVLRAFDAGNLSNEIYNSGTIPSRDKAGLAVRFTVPTVANGKVYVGTQGELDVYGLLP
jgi:hypothetical protein